MARLFRLYEKKRGDRRTGSRTVASVGEALFFGVFLAAGCAALAATLQTLVIPEWRVNRHFAATTCQVLGKRVSVKIEEEGPTYRPEIDIRYQIGDRTYHDTTYDVARRYNQDRETVEAIVAQFDEGQERPCWFDPMNPSRSVLVRGYSGWMYLLLLIPASFIVIGGGGLVYTLTHWSFSAERRALLMQRGARLNPFADLGDVGPRFPAVPKDANLTNSPGTSLAYRLPIAATGGWRLFGSLAACLLWNGIVIVLIVTAIQLEWAGVSAWQRLLFLVPFAAIGAWLIHYFARQLYRATGAGATRLEISHHPLRPGRKYHVLVSQAGRLSVNLLETLLVCEEIATYLQGTDTRTEKRQIYRQTVFQKSAFEIQPSLPFEEKCQIQIPEQAMHSFKADHNEISWKLVVRAEAEGWTAWERTFPVIVYPPLPNVS